MRNACRRTGTSPAYWEMEIGSAGAHATLMGDRNGGCTSALGMRQQPPRRTACPSRSTSARWRLKWGRSAALLAKSLRVAVTDHRLWHTDPIAGGDHGIYSRSGPWADRRAHNRRNLSNL